MLSNQQIETFIYAYRQQLEALKAQQTSINSAITQLQNNLKDLEAVSSGDSTISNVNVLTDSYVVGDSVLHRLKHLFQAAVTFVTDVAIQGVLTLSTALGVVYGGTGATTAAGARANLNAAALPQTINGSNFQYPGQGATVCAGSQTVTVPGSSFTAPAGGGPCTGSFDVTINGTSFTFTVVPANNTGSQNLV